MATGSVRTSGKNPQAAKLDQPGKKRPRAASANEALYLYGITEAESDQSVISEPGVDASAPIEVVGCSGLLCWVSRVSQTEFVNNLASNMENLDWLANAGVKHQRIVSELGRRATVLAARFGT